MRILLTFSICLFALLSQAQCEKCTSLKDALKKPEKVIELRINPYLHDITLDSIPVSIGKLVNVEILFLTDHPYEMVPREIGQLKKLRKLSFAGCRLKELPEEIFSLTELNEMILMNNEFSDDYKASLKEKFAEKLPQVKLRL